MLWNLLGKTASTGLGFVLMIVIARWLTPSDFGDYSLIMAIFSTGLLVTSLGLETGLLKYLPEFRANNEMGHVKEIVGSALVGKSLLLVLAAAVLIAGSNFILGHLFGSAGLQKIHLFVIPLLLIPCGLNALFRSILDSHYRQQMLNIVDVVQISGRLLLTLFLLRSGDRILGVLIASAIVEWTVLLWFLHACRFAFPTLRFGITPQTRKLVSLSLAVWVTSFAGFMLGRTSDVLLLGYFTDSKAVGLYNLAATFANQAYLFLTLPLGNLGLIAASELYGERSESGLAKITELLLKYHLLFVPPVCVGGILLAEPLIRCLYGESYLPATVLLQFYMIAAGVQILFAGTFAGLLTSIEQQRILMVSSLGFGVANVLLNLFLVPRFGVMGALAGTGAINAVSVAWLGYILKRRVRWQFPVALALKTLLAAAIMTAAVFALRQYAINAGMLLFVIALGGLVYALALRASRPFSDMDLALLRNSRVPGNRFVLRLLAAA